MSRQIFISLGCRLSRVANYSAEWGGPDGHKVWGACTFDGCITQGPHSQFWAAQFVLEPLEPGGYRNKVFALDAGSSLANHRPLLQCNDKNGKCMAKKHEVRPGDVFFMQGGVHRDVDVTAERLDAWIRELVKRKVC